MNKVDENNVLDFLKGYEKNYWNSHFFVSLHNKNGVSNKDSLITSVSYNLINYLNTNNQNALATELQTAKENYTKQKTAKNAAALDKIVKKALQAVQ